eukprot:TRINITY_DN30002_c0_g2_i1.p1 TRINITY_DN30002_c0_g2~~TRINITY_DN30002_c0_g2_i1.p1  ORF type:complete len:878 (+),score=223.68 TRINITY_DN30002_c0_g2_i1:75-2636(+)
MLRAAGCAVLLPGAAVLAAVALRYLPDRIEPAACTMTYMYPGWHPIEVPGSRSAYALRRYDEGGRPPAERTAPLLFVHGNAGSSSQARSLGTLLARRPGGSVHTVYSASFDEELSAFSSALLRAQGEYISAALGRVAELHPGTAGGGVGVVAHSMGAVAVCLAAAQSPGRVAWMIALAAPLAHPPAALYGGILQVYRAMRRTPPRVPVVALSGGARDVMVRGAPNAPAPWLASAAGSTDALPGAGLSCDHLAILWCNQVMRRVAAAAAAGAGLSGAAALRALSGALGLGSPAGGLPRGAAGLGQGAAVRQLHPSDSWAAALADGGRRWGCVTGDAQGVVVLSAVPADQLRLRGAAAAHVPHLAPNAFPGEAARVDPWAPVLRSAAVLPAGGTVCAEHGAGRTWLGVSPLPRREAGTLLELSGSRVRGPVYNVSIRALDARWVYAVALAPSAAGCSPAVAPALLLSSPAGSVWYASQRAAPAPGGGQRWTLALDPPRAAVSAALVVLADPECEEVLTVAVDWVASLGHFAAVAQPGAFITGAAAVLLLAAAVQLQGAGAGAGCAAAAAAAVLLSACWVPAAAGVCARLHATAATQWAALWGELPPDGGDSAALAFADDSGAALRALAACGAAALAGAFVAATALVGRASRAAAARWPWGPRATAGAAACASCAAALAPHPAVRCAAAAAALCCAHGCSRPELATAGAAAALCYGRVHSVAVWGAGCLLLASRGRGLQGAAALAAAGLQLPSLVAALRQANPQMPPPASEDDSPAAAVGLLLQLAWLPRAREGNCSAGAGSAVWVLPLCAAAAWLLGPAGLAPHLALPALGILPWAALGAEHARRGTARPAAKQD